MTCTNVKYIRAVYSDNSTSFAGERLDCSIRAFSVAACISYEESHQLFEKHGRQTGHATSTSISTKVWQEAFPSATYVRINPGMTLNQFVSQYKTGHYIVHVRHHALAVCDGVIYDWKPGIKRKVVSAFKLI